MKRTPEQIRAELSEVSRIHAQLESLVKNANTFFRSSAEEGCDSSVLECRRSLCRDYQRAAQVLDTVTTMLTYELNDSVRLTRGAKQEDAPNAASS